MKGEGLNRWAAWALGVLLAAGVLTVWIPAVWPAAVFQAGVMAVAMVYCFGHAWTGGGWRFPGWLVALGLIPGWAAVQWGAGWTLDRWATAGKVTEWTATVAAAFVLVQVAGDRRVREGLLTGLLVFSTVLAVQALLQTFTSGGRVFWLFESGYEDNVLGPFVYHNKYAQFVELVFPLALWRALTRRGQGPLWLVAAAILFAGAVAGASRSGFAILLLELPAVLLLAWRREAISGRAAGWASAQAAGLLAIWGFVAGFEMLWLRLTGIDPLADLRWPLMRSTWEMAMAHPWTGAGLGAWPAVYPEFARFDTGLFANQAHCDWLQWAAEGGMVVVLLLGVFLARVLPGLLRSVWGVGFLTVCVHGVIDYPFHQLPAFTTFIFCVGALAALEGEEEERQNG